MSYEKTIVLTGLTGVVGSALIPVLIKRKYRIVAIVRKIIDEQVGVSMIVGDVTKPDFGIDVDELLMVYGKVDCIIHSAAITSFDKTDNEINETNVNGTINAALLANKVSARLLYVSTAYVHDLKLPEHMTEYSSYCKSKRLAEKKVREIALDWKIVRPSIVIGDSKSGEIKYFQGMHNIMGAVLMRFFPIFPAIKTSLVDLIPQDILAEAICGLVTHKGGQSEFWVTRGEGARTVTDVHELIEQFSLGCGCAKDMPKMVDPEVINRLYKPAFFSSLPSYMRKRMNSLIDYSCYFNSSEPFPSNYNILAEELGLRSMPDYNEVLINNMEFWAEKTKYRSRVA